MFSCKFCKNFKNSLFTEHLWKTASVPCTIFFYKSNFMRTNALILAKKNKAKLAVPQNIRGKCLGQDIRTNWDVYVILVPWFLTEWLKMSIKIGLFFFLTFCCIITPIFGIIDHSCTTENFKKLVKNTNKLRTIYPKNHENFKNSKPRVQFYWFL